jgi:hypothetical protein
MSFTILIITRLLNVRCVSPATLAETNSTGARHAAIRIAATVVEWTRDEETEASMQAARASDASRAAETATAEAVCPRHTSLR